MYTFYTEGGQRATCGFISAFSLLYSIPVVMLYLLVSRGTGSASTEGSRADGRHRHCDEPRPRSTRTGCAPSTRWTSRSPTASSSPCSARPAAARPRCCGRSPAWRPPPAAGAHRRPGRHPPAARASATWRWSSRTTRCSRTWTSRTTSPTRCGSRQVPGASAGGKAAETGSGLGLGSACWNAGPGSSPAASSSGSRWPARWPASRKVFLLDEPLSNLDARLRLEARTFLKKLQRSSASPPSSSPTTRPRRWPWPTGSPSWRPARSGRSARPREVFHRPANTFVANFIGSTPMNLLPGALVGGQLNVGGRRVASSLRLVRPDVRDAVGRRPARVPDARRRRPDVAARRGRRRREPRRLACWCRVQVRRTLSVQVIVPEGRGARARRPGSSSRPDRAGCWSTTRDGELLGSERAGRAVELLAPSALDLRGTWTPADRAERQVPAGRRSTSRRAATALAVALTPTAPAAR